MRVVRGAGEMFMQGGAARPARGRKRPRAPQPPIYPEIEARLEQANRWLDPGEP